MLFLYIDSTRQLLTRKVKQEALEALEKVRKEIREWEAAPLDLQ